MIDILESNKLLAEYMGAVKYNGGNFFIPGHGVVNPDTIDLGKGRIIQYHKSWDWLMPVIRKINLRPYIEEGEVIVDEIIHHLPDADIDKVYETVVEFVKWWNKWTKKK